MHQVETFPVSFDCDDVAVGYARVLFAGCGEGGHVVVHKDGDKRPLAWLER